MLLLAVSLSAKGRDLQSRGIHMAAALLLFGNLGEVNRLFMNHLMLTVGHHVASR
jgi:hypothetical protein